MDFDHADAQPQKLFHVSHDVGGMTRMKTTAGDQPLGILLAVIGESVANLLEPWPLKIVLDNVLKTRPIHGWLNRFVLSTAGDDKIAVLKFACAFVIVIAVFDAICSYAEKYFTTSVAQWVTHDLRRTLYLHIQRLSLAFHDQKKTGDLISRVTSDIDSIQSFITSGLLGGVINVITLLGMVGVMLYLNWKFTLIALSVAPILFAVVFSYTRRIKKASRAVRKKEGEIVSVIEEVFSSIRVVKAFAREEYEQRRLEEESLEGVEIALQARSLKAKLAPLVQIIVAVGTCLVLWYGTRMVLSTALSAGSLIVFEDDGYVFESCRWLRANSGSDADRQGGEGFTQISASPPLQGRYRVRSCRL